MSSSGIEGFEKVFLIINKKSNRGIKEGFEALDWLKSEKIKHSYLFSNSIEETKEFMRAYSTTQALFISVSGDGGYNAVVNQAMLTNNSPFVVAWPGGNANDWFSMFGDKGKLKKAILSASIRNIDLLEIIIDNADIFSSYRFYAHSYVGFGLTADTAIILEKAESLKGKIVPEATLVLREVVTNKGIPLEDAFGEKLNLRSLTIHNSPRMAKLFKVRNSICDDGLFEIVHLHQDLSFPQKIALGVLGRLEGTQANEYCLYLPHEANIQIDGEVKKISKGSTIYIRIASKALKTLDWDI